VTDPGRIDAELDSVKRSADGSRVILLLRDPAGQRISLSLPASCLHAVLAAAPEPAEARTVHSVAAWSMSAAGNDQDMTLTFCTAEGMVVSFSIKSWQALGIATIATYGSARGAVGGSLHGGASFGAEVMLRSATQPAEAVRVVGDLLRRGERIPGFGHFVYRGSDPRAVLLMELVRNAAAGSERLAVADAVIAEARRRALPEPNIDFALAVLASAAGMIPGGGEAVFAIARTAGWLAHALEEYARGTPIRPRGIYTGPAWAPL